MAPPLALAAASYFAAAAVAASTSLLLLLAVFLCAYRRPSQEPAPQPAAAAPPAPPLASGEEEEAAGAAEGSGEVACAGEKRRKRKGRRKQRQEKGEGVVDESAAATAAAAGGWGMGAGRPGFPFSSVASGMQRRIKSHYDELVRSNQAKAVTVDQVGQFINCLVEARNELQHKSEIIQRSFKIRKALLFKADRSSFDRLCQQVHKLEAEHKRLEEDAAVYNLLQEQLKLSPAYQTMLEISANMEAKAEDDATPELPDISFEELLAQEKKDSFWQRNGKLRSIAN